MQYCEPAVNSHILTSLRATLPVGVIEQLRKKIITFEDLALGDDKGIQKLLKLTSIRDLALSLKGTPEAILHKIANNLSQRAIADLKEEIEHLGRRPLSEVEEARIRIVANAKKLVERKELYFIRSREDWVD